MALSYSEHSVQGQDEGDLGDILAGITHLTSTGVNTSSRIGIFGGSYGGYMAMRGLALSPEVFMCGVAMYGYIHNRWMSYEAGDFTFEDEYLTASRRQSAWPLEHEVKTSSS